MPIEAGWDMHCSNQQLFHKKEQATWPALFSLLMNTDPLPSWRDAGATRSWCG